MLKTADNLIKYRPIGDEFEFCGVTLRVEICVSEDGPCAGCFFENHVSCPGYGETGTCMGGLRPDGKDVIFAKKGGEEC